MRNLSLGNLIKYFSIILIIIFFNSCLTINSEMKINSNGSGTININYKLERGLVGISTLGSDDEIVPIDLSEDKIVQLIGGRDDIVYENYSLKENDNDYIVNVTFLFDNIDALNSILPVENAVSLIREGSETIFTQGIVAETNEDINEVTLEILEDIYKDHSFSLEVKVPSDIIAVLNGNKIETRTALYSEKFLDIISSNDKKVWSIRW